jgi:precorrin-2 dehydrogenase/sirohydrochlorin ferrochelatase
VLAEADVTLVSPSLALETVAYVEASGVHYRRRKFRAEDAAGCYLVIAATDSDEVNSSVSRHARQAGAIVNVVDGPELSDFTLPATVRRGNLLLTASTGGTLPAFSRLLRERLEHSFGEEYAVYLELAEALRPIIKRCVPDPARRREIFFRLADFDLAELSAENPALFRRKLGEILPAQVLDELGGLPVSGAAPGHSRESRRTGER